MAVVRRPACIIMMSKKLDLYGQVASCAHPLALAPARPQYSLAPPRPGKCYRRFSEPYRGTPIPPSPPPRARAAHFKQIRTLLVAGPPAEVTITTCRRPPVSRLIFVLLFCCFVVLFESNQQTENFVARQVLYSMSGFAG